MSSGLVPQRDLSDGSLLRPLRSLRRAAQNLAALGSGALLAACTFPEYDVPHSITSVVSPNGGTDTSGSGGVGAGGAGGMDTGGIDAAGSADLGSSGSSAAPACEPSATDTRCDGLDETCSPTSADAACSANCVPHIHGDHTYMRCTPPPSLTFDQAESTCEANGMHLVVIDDATENAYLTSLMTRKTDPYVWIGGISDQTEVFHWVSGPVFYDHGVVKGVYQNFSPGGPDLAPLLRCVQLETSGIWSAAHCTDMQAYICEL